MFPNHYSLIIPNDGKKKTKIVRKQENKGNTEDDDIRVK